MTCFTSHQSSAVDNEAEGDCSTCGLVSVMTCFTSSQPSALYNEARERESLREICIDMSHVIGSIDKFEYQPSMIGLII